MRQVCRRRPQSPISLGPPGAQRSLTPGTPLDRVRTFLVEALRRGTNPIRRQQPLVPMSRKRQVPGEPGQGLGTLQCSPSKQDAAAQEPEQKPDPELGPQQAVPGAQKLDNVKPNRDLKVQVGADLRRRRRDVAPVDEGPVPNEGVIISFDSLHDVRLPVLLKGTSDDDAPCPGYLFEEIAKISHESLGSSQCLLEYLLNRLHSGSGRVKLKVLKIMLHLCAHGSSSFLLILKRNPAFIQEAAGFTGPPDPLHGNSLYQQVRAAAQDLGSTLFSDTLSPPPPSQPPRALPPAGMGSQSRPQGALRGFGYSREHGPTGEVEAVTLSDCQQELSLVQMVTQGPRPFLCGRGHEPFLSRTPGGGLPCAPARHQPGQAGGGWDEQDSSPGSQGSCQDNGQSRASGSGTCSGNFLNKPVTSPSAFPSCVCVLTRVCACACVCSQCVHVCAHARVCACACVGPGPEEWVRGPPISPGFSRQAPRSPAACCPEATGPGSSRAINNLRRSSSTTQVHQPQAKQAWAGPLRPAEPPDFLMLFESSPGGNQRPASVSRASSEKGATWNVLVNQAAITIQRWYRHQAQRRRAQATSLGHLLASKLEELLEGSPSPSAGGRCQLPDGRQPGEVREAECARRAPRGRDAAVRGQAAEYHLFWSPQASWSPQVRGSPGRRGGRSSPGTAPPDTAVLRGSKWRRGRGAWSLRLRQARL
ncbi:hypothetical protein D623_10005096 [Myotis brandtii]|uniref:AP-4 complex accessory subunit Tepsin n=1 Tax=Myotis brandtii TaxID=109478 RepID=S7Q6G6_MYOBR|nr:hypothetical protein D623_10005096 [Myotis brandtii]